MAFLGGVFDRIGDAVDGVTGKSGTKLVQAELDNQRYTNTQLIELEKQKLLQQQTPEYQAAKQKRFYLAGFVMVVCVGLAFVLFRQKT